VSWVYNPTQHILGHFRDEDQRWTGLEVGKSTGMDLFPSPPLLFHIHPFTSISPPPQSRLNQLGSLGEHCKLTGSGHKRICVIFWAQKTHLMATKPFLCDDMTDELTCCHYDMAVVRKKTVAVWFQAGQRSAGMWYHPTSSPGPRRTHRKYGDNCH